ncbi:MAG: helix-turn-helix domain-containing protein [Magnetococcus sp. YQC-5]
MNDQSIEIVRGSGNVFADFGHPNASIEQLKAVLAGEIIGVLDRHTLTVRKAESLTGIAAADFSRIRKTKLDRFTIDLLLTILDRLDQTVELSFTARNHHEVMARQHVLG